MLFEIFLHNYCPVYLRSAFISNSSMYSLSPFQGCRLSLHILAPSHWVDLKFAGHTLHSWHHQLFLEHPPCSCVKRIYTWALNSPLCELLFCSLKGMQWTNRIGSYPLLSTLLSYIRIYLPDPESFNDRNWQSETDCQSLSS